MIHKQSYYTVKVHIFHTYCEKSVKTYLFSSLGAEILMLNTRLLKVLKKFNSVSLFFHDVYIIKSKIIPFLSANFFILVGGILSMLYTI